MSPSWAGSDMVYLSLECKIWARPKSLSFDCIRPRQSKLSVCLDPHCNLHFVFFFILGLSQEIVAKLLYDY